MFQQIPAGQLDLGSPIGKIVDVNGLDVHVVHQGDAGPLVWFLNGWLGLTPSLQPFLELLGTHARAYSYDRAGNAWSDPNGMLRTAQNEADEFAALLDELGQTEPFVLVAWSGGGPVAQCFAAKHPHQVRGLILLDAIPPEYNLWVTRTYPHRYAQEHQQNLEVIRGVAQKAAVDDLVDSDVQAYFEPISVERYGDAYKKLLRNNPNYWWTYYWQNQFAITSSFQVQAAVRVGDTPLKILIATHPPDDTSHYRQASHRMWQTLQHAQSALSTRSEVIYVDAGHAIHRDQPQVVIDAILDVDRLTHP